MPFTLFPPGTRKGNRFFVVRGKIDGRDVEVSTKTRDETAARIFALEFERRCLESGVPGQSEAVTWSRAADFYSAARRVSRDDERYIARLKKIIGEKPVRAIRQVDLDDAATRLHPSAAPETINRQVYTPAIAILNYAVSNDWCDERKWRRPKIGDPATRAAAPDAGVALVNATEGDKRLLLLWLWKHGTRISDALRVRWSGIDLTARTYELWISKARRWKTFPMDDEVWELLVNAPEDERRGTLFPWGDRHNVYRWLRPLAEQLGVHFTPHMARHRLGRDLSAAGAGLRTIMDALGQKSPKSALRYVSEDVEVVRLMQAKRKRVAGTDAGK